MILGDEMDAILIAYQGVSDEYVNEVVDILKHHNFFVATESIIENELIDKECIHLGNENMHTTRVVNGEVSYCSITIIVREYTHITNERIFTPKHAAAVMLDSMTRREYPPIRYITNKIVYNGNYKRKPYFTRYDDNLNVVKSCDKCPYCVDEISVSRFICNKANREIGYASQQTFPEWCPLTDG